MLASRRVVSVPALGALLATRALVHPSYRAHAVVRRRVVSEDALLTRAFERKGHGGRPVLTILLEGAARITVRGRHWFLAPGDASLVDAKGDILMRQEGDPFRSVVVEWDPPLLGARPAGVRVAPASAALRAAADALHRRIDALEEDDEDVDLFCALLSRATSWGLVVPPRSALVADVSPRMRSLSRALDRLATSLGDRPMLVDLDGELGLSSRQVNRLVEQFHAAYAFNAGGWRDTRNRWRVMFGATLMTAPGATPDVVARAVGFSSTNTQARAFANAGLPAPGDVRSVVAALGEQARREALRHGPLGA